MAEEWGEVIIKASDDITAIFASSDFNAALYQLANYAGIDSENVETSNTTVDEVECKAGYVYLSYDCSEWVDLSNVFTSQGKNIEYYSRHNDEYGTLSFFALTANGTKLGFQFDEDGDAMEDETYQEEVTTKLNAWKAAIPDAVKQAFPEFSAIEADDYIY